MNTRFDQLLYAMATKPPLGKTAKAGQTSSEAASADCDGRAFPIVFSADTEDAVISKAEAFRSEAVAKHEATYLARQAAAAKAREARKRKTA